MPHDNRSLYTLYFNSGVRELIPIYPLYAVMFSEHGITPIELSTLFALWAFVGIVFEVPSGALADRFSRKWLIVASGFLKAAGFVSWFLWQDFYGYALGFILWGLGSTLRSGAFEALLHDQLASEGREFTFTRHYGRIAALGTFGVMLGELGGGVLIANGYDSVLLASAVAPLVATIPVIFFVKDIRMPGTASDTHYFTILKSGLAASFKNPVLLYLLLVFTFLVVTFGIYDEYTGVVLRDKGFSLSMVAYLGVPIFLAQAAGQALADRFAFLGLPRLLTIIAAASALLLAVPSLEGAWIPVVMTAYFFTFGLVNTVFQGKLQSAIPGDARATITSVVGLGDSLGAILWFFVFGSLAELTSIVSASFGLGVIAILICGMLAVLGARWQVALGPR